MKQAIANRRYAVELTSALAVYTLLLVMAVRGSMALSPGPARTALCVLPMLGVLLAVWAIARHMGRIDEYARKRSLEYLGVAAAVTAGWTLTYGFLEGAGWPRLSMFTVWPVMGVVWGSLACIGAIRER